MRRSLRSQLTLLIATVAVLPALAGGLLLYWGAREHVRDEVLQRMTALADRTQVSIERRMGDRLTDCAVYAGPAAIPLRQQCARLIAGHPSPGETLDSLRAGLSAQLAAAVTIKAYYTDAVLIDLQSNRPIAWSVAPGATPEQILEGTDLTAVRRGLGVRMSAAHRHPVTGQPVADIVGPIQPPGPGGLQAPPLAALLLHVDLHKALGSVTEDRVGLGRTGEIVLVDELVRPVLPVRSRPSGVLEVSLPPQSVARRAARGQNGITDGLDYRGVHVLGAYRYLPAEKWGLVVKMDAGEAYAGIAHLGWITAAILMALAALGVALSRGTATQISRPILDLSSAARRVAAGDLEVRVASQRTDELGVLARDFDEMVEELSVAHEQLESIIQQLRTTNEQLHAEVAHRREVERALQESEAQYRELVQNANSAIIRWTRDGTLTFFNEYAEAFFGYPADEVIGKPVTLLVPATDSGGADLTALVRDIVEEPERFTSNVNENVCRDGCRVWMAWTNRVIRNDRGEVAEVLAVGTDITPQVRAEIELRDTRDFLQNLLDYANAPVIVWDPELRITLFNHAFERLTGRGASGVVGQPIDLLFPPDSRRFAALQHIHRAMAGEHWETVEIPIAHVSGDVRTVLWNSATLRGSDGETVLATIAQGQDISDRTEAEAALRGTRDFLQNLLDYANAPVIVWDPELRITLFNHAFERLTGRSASDVLGQRIDLLFPGDRREEALAHIRRASEGERWETVEIPIAELTGDARTVLWNSATLRGLDGETVATIAQGQDITERKRAEAALQRAVVQLEAANAELALLLSVASHDLREPMRNVQVSLQMIQRRHAQELPPPGQALLERAIEASRRLNALMEDTLAYARVGSVALAPCPTDSAALVARVLGDLDSVIQEAAATVTCEPLPAATADAALLGRVFQNLISNAIKFRGADPPLVRIAAERRGDEWVFSVSDNGIGMAAEYLDRIFQPFERLHSRDDYPGSGVGLAVCRRVIERHGGRIWAESSPGQGSTFFFTLPAA